MQNTHSGQIPHTLTVPSVHIRPSTPEDTPYLEELYQATWHHAFPLYPKGAMGHYQEYTRGDTVWVAEMGGRLVGFVAVCPADNFIHGLLVHPQYQKKHIGSQLLCKAEENLGRPLTLNVSKDNLKVGEFYEKQGWRLLSEEEKVRVKRARKNHATYQKD